MPRTREDVVEWSRKRARREEELAAIEAAAEKKARKKAKKAKKAAKKAAAAAAAAAAAEPAGGHAAAAAGPSNALVVVGQPQLADYQRAQQERQARMVGRLPLGAEGDDTAVGYRKGRWSAREAEICTARLREVLESAGLTPESDEFLRALRQPRRVGKAGSGDEDDEDAAGEARSQLFHGRRNSFWRELTDAVNASLEEEGLPPRKRKVVSDWVHNRFLGRNGPWSADETARLTAMRRGGAKWSDIAVELGRYVQDVRQKFQQTEPVARRGDWLEEEEAALGELVREAMKRAAEGQGLDAEALRATAAWMGGGGEGGAERDWCELGRPGAPTQAVDSLQRGLPWEAIATKLASETGSGRSAKQCRQKWTLGINPLVNAGRATGRFTEDLELVRRLHELGADDASDVSWASLVPSLDSRRAKERLQTLARRLDGFDGWVANGEVGEVVDRLLPILEAECQDASTLRLTVAP